MHMCAHGMRSSSPVMQGCCCLAARQFGCCNVLSVHQQVFSLPIIHRACPAQALSAAHCQSCQKQAGRERHACTVQVDLRMDDQEVPGLGIRVHAVYYGQGMDRWLL